MFNNASCNNTTCPSSFSAEGSVQGESRSVLADLKRVPLTTAAPRPTLSSGCWCGGECLAGSLH